MNILLARVGRLGDMVMILPAFFWLKKQYPQAHFYMITSLDGVRLFRTLRLIDEDRLWQQSHVFGRKFLDAYHIRKKIKNIHFDLIYCFESKKSTINLLPSSAHILQNADSIEHYAMRCLQLVGAPYQMPEGPYLPVDRFLQKRVIERLRSYSVNDNTILIGFHPTYSGYGKMNKRHEHPHRMWPTNFFADLGRKLESLREEWAQDIVVMMDLLPEEMNIAHEITRKSGGRVKILSVSKSFSEYLALLSRYQVLVVSNTGIMHLAAALNVPLVALFSGNDPNDCGPFMSSSRSIVLTAEQDGTLEGLGLQKISVDKVFESVKKLLNRC